MITSFEVFEINITQNSVDLLKALSSFKRRNATYEGESDYAFKFISDPQSIFHQDISDCSNRSLYALLTFRRRLSALITQLSWNCALSIKQNSKSIEHWSPLVTQQYSPHRLSHIWFVLLSWYSCWIIKTFKCIALLSMKIE